MGKPLPWVLTAIMMAVAFAGCVGVESGSPQEATNQPKVSSGPAEFDENTGAIAGIVTDTELAPLAGAQVGLLKSEILPEDVVVLTDKAGQFTISRVPPGTHSLFVQALGFQSKGSKISVNAGEVAQANVALEKLPSDEPYHLTDVRKAAVSGVMIKLTPQCIYDIGGQGQTLAKTCQGVRTGCDPSANCEVHYTKLLEDNPHWKTILGEMTWTPQTGLTGKGFFFDINAPNVPRGTGGSINQGSGYTFYRMQPRPPIIWRIDNSTTLMERKIAEKDWCCDWFYRIFPGNCDVGSLINNCEATPDYGIAQQNPGTVYMTFFFKEPAPQGYTSLPDK